MCYESHMALKIKDSSLKKTWVHMDFNQVNRRWPHTDEFNL